MHYNALNRCSNRERRRERTGFVCSLDVDNCQNLRRVQGGGGVKRAKQEPGALPGADHGAHSLVMQCAGKLIDVVEA